VTRCRLESRDMPWDGESLVKKMVTNAATPPYLMEGRNPA
jgi:hypothetical protein